jgi:hypothetical protein
MGPETLRKNLHHTVSVVYAKCAYIKGPRSG